MFELKDNHVYVDDYVNRRGDQNTELPIEILDQNVEFLFVQNTLLDHNVENK
jgi:hypothetical protein